MKRIFVRGMSRSGGTLMATVMDAHPDVAMCYEVYEHLLQPAEGEDDSIDRLTDSLRDATSGFKLQKERALKKIDDSGFQKFVFRAMRGGVEADVLLQMMEEHRAAGSGFANFEQRMLFIERLALAKAQQEGKTHWGTKIGSIQQPLHELWPDAHFLFMQRDGRDVAASRKMVGDFGQGIDHIAGAWRDQIRRFRKFSEQPGVHVHFVRYETLVTNPEPELRAIVDFLDLPWSDQLLAHQDQDLTIYRNPTGHLSRDQVNKPMNDASIGRWKRDLTADEVVVFEREAGELLAELGYEPAAVAADT